MLNAGEKGSLPRKASVSPIKKGFPFKTTKVVLPYHIKYYHTSLFLKMIKTWLLFIIYFLTFKMYSVLFNNIPNPDLKYKMP